jgi:hypothetical protein
METFALSLHPQKTRLIEFGRVAAENRKRRGLGKPETFTFLGFAHICGRTHRGKFLLERIPAQGRWLGQIVRGYFAYHAIPTNSRALSAFLHYVADTVEADALASKPTWLRDLGDDAAAGHTVAADAARFTSLALSAIRRQTPEVGAECVNCARSDLGGGRAEMRVPTAIEGQANHLSCMTIILGPASSRTGKYTRCVR